jgi:hypothetical protein
MLDRKTAKYWMKENRILDGERQKVAYRKAEYEKGGALN